MSFRLPTKIHSSSSTDVLNDHGSIPTQVIRMSLTTGEQLESDILLVTDFEAMPLPHPNRAQTNIYLVKYYHCHRYAKAHRYAKHDYDTLPSKLSPLGFLS